MPGSLAEYIDAIRDAPQLAHEVQRSASCPAPDFLESAWKRATVTIGGDAANQLCASFAENG